MLPFNVENTVKKIQCNIMCGLHGCFSKGNKSRGGEAICDFVI